MKIPKSMFILPAVPLTGSVIRHFSPEWITDISWVMSGILSVIMGFAVIAMQIAKEIEKE